VDDRTEAIAHAIGMAEPGDVILLAGKGHEASIFYGTEKRSWDDRAAARRALADAGWGTP
jgi:UDP-N-acetylmuramoyl-L-alanyl-D-glutamate--2,6-diaminopimelate ligase